ncbi:MAG: trypsin-like serine protease [Solirubrobacteraceae bacterium]|nr:trypsin-like serine protease [Solirubrobacteraceae bacterium]
MLLLFVPLFTPHIANADESGPQGRVIAGTATTAPDVSPTGRWSAVVAIFATDAQGTRLCTGTLISANWVVTAAHCIADESNASVAISPDNVFVAANVTSTQNAGNALVSAHSTSVHPGFSWVDASWDVALIELDHTVNTTPFALPDPLRANTYVVGSSDNVAGFGRSQASNSASSGTLRSGRIEQVGGNACETYNPGSGEYSDCYLPGSARQATCFGDSGGPLVRYDSTQGGAPVVWGITSTGPDPCDAATGGQFAPSYETRVIAVVDWLKATMSGSTFVPTPSASVRTSGVSTATKSNTGNGTVNSSGATRAPAGGTGIGIFQAKLSAKVSRKKAGKVTLSSSFVGATGTGKVEVIHCLKGKCKTTAKANVSYSAMSTAVATTVKVPRCKKKATLTLRLSVYDTTGALKDQASQRLARCS